MNNQELITFIIKKLKVKPIKQTNTRVTLRKLSTLKRIPKIYNNNYNKIGSKYNTLETVQNVNKHYWIDMWSDSGLVTFQYDEK